MIFDKFKVEYKALTDNLSCGNIIIDNFLKSNDALDENQGITYVLLSDEKDFIIGYYNISVGRVDQIETIGDSVCYIPMGGAVNINYLAVDERLQNTKVVDDCTNRTSEVISSIIYIDQHVGICTWLKEMKINIKQNCVRVDHTVCTEYLILTSIFSFPSFIYCIVCTLMS